MFSSVIKFFVRGLFFRRVGLGVGEVFGSSVFMFRVAREFVLPLAVGYYYDFTGVLKTGTVKVQERLDTLLELLRGIID